MHVFESSEKAIVLECSRIQFPNYAVIVQCVVKIERAASGRRTSTSSKKSIIIIFFSGDPCFCFYCEIPILTYFVVVVGLSLWLCVPSLHPDILASLVDPSPLLLPPLHAAKPSLADALHALSLEPDPSLSSQLPAVTKLK